MIPCSQCKFWREDLCPRENYGECINGEQIDRMIHDAKHLYRFDGAKCERALERYNPYITAKDHRCILGEERL